MAFVRVNGGIAGRPGVGLYDISEEQFRQCCCRGLIIAGINFETIGQPDCFLQKRGSPTVKCFRVDDTPEAALGLAINYIGETSYITKCNPTEENPDPETNFCQNKIPTFSYTTTRETSAGYEIDFEVEDCGIEPVDYIATVQVDRCY